MKVLWFAVTPSMYDEQKRGGWIASLEQIMRNYHPNISLGIAFEHSDNCFKQKSDNVTYYPIKKCKTVKDRILYKIQDNYEWKIIIPIMHKIIDDFKPDIIQCFGSEWPFAMIANYIDIPVVVHMQGFLNIYNTSSEMAYSTFNSLCYEHFGIKSIYRALVKKRKQDYSNSFERELMKCNKYFMGRTEWDRNIVNYYSHDATYFYCPEALRPEIYNSKKTWTYRENEVTKLVTISQASELKGNEIVLRTAQILKHEFGFEFSWRVAGDVASFKRFEKKTGIRHEDVNVTLIGMIDAETVVSELAEAHAYVHTAIIDNSPNSLCEAQVIGCPVISANTGGISSLVQDGVTGILYPYNEPHALAFRIMEIKNNKELLNVLSENERKTSILRHSPKEIATKIIDIYEEIINKNVKRSND